jgi:hypothetical protein
LIDAAQASMDLLIETLPNRDDGGPAPKELALELSDWAKRRGAGADSRTALRAVLTLSRLHGFVSLEIAGNYASVGIDADQLFETELRELPA